MSHLSPTNLPDQPNPLLGREPELQAACEQLRADEVRLLSLTGPPGVGKTRLALAAAAALLADFPDGVWFVDLAPLTDPALVGSAVASTFGVAEFNAEALLASLAAYLQSRKVLLFLDNFEQVLPAAPWVGKLLERTPGLKILATSRERLRLRWERTLVVQPLPLPDPGRPVDLAVLAQVPSVALFVQRAAAVQADFALTVENAAAVAALCARLDGLPLAIELSAAHAGVLSPAEILANMDRRFRLLGTGALDLPERHQTLKAAIDWSYDSLASAEQRFLSRLSVFAGGFTAQAAEIVGDSDGLDLDGLGTLIALVEKSLVVRQRGPAGETRFTLLESIRDYLLEKLRQSGDQESTRRRHATVFLDLAEQNYAGMKQGNQRVWFDRLEAEHDNLRRALQWSLDANEPAVGARIAAALWYFWWLRGHIREGVRWLETFLEGGDSQGETHLRLLEGAGLLRGWQGDFDPGLARLNQALDLAQERSDPAAVARTLGWLGWVLWVNGRTEQAIWLAEKMESSHLAAEPWDLAYAYLSSGSLLYEAALDDAAEGAFSRALEYFGSAEEKHGAIFAGGKLALLQQKKGEPQRAKSQMIAALEAARQLNDLHVIAYGLDDALQLLAAEAAASTPAAAKAAAILGAVDHWREILSLLRTPREQAAYQTLTASLKQRLGEAAFQQAWQAGKTQAPEGAIQEVVQLLEAPGFVGAKERAGHQPEGGFSPLSERERQVLGGVAEGLSNQEIADRLFITERTVRFHTTSIFNKLGAENRAQAVAIATRLGLL